LNPGDISLLIVDDNEINLNLLCRYLLRKDGFTVTAAESGRQALELIEAQPFDLVLLDLLMPDLSGYDVLKKVRQSFSMIELPIIMLTARQESDALVETLHLGANDYVVKPIDFNVLNARIDTQIALKRKEKAYRLIKENLEQLVRERTENLDKVNKTLEKDRQNFEYLLSSSPAITYATSIDMKQNCKFVSQNLYKYLGYSPEQMINDPEFWITHIHPEDKQYALTTMEYNLKNDGGDVEYRFLHRDGAYRWIRDQQRVIRENDTPVEIVGSWTDITEQQKLREEVDYRIRYDDLTGLINRREFENRLQYILGHEEAKTGQHVVCYLDLDQFKVINESYGHIVGDQLLRQLSDVLQKRLSRRDILAYLGGDDFGVLLQHCTLNQAHRILEIIQDTIREFRFLWEGKSLAITASIGVVPFNRYTGDSTNILSLANSACFAAKEAGRNRIHVYTETDDSLGKRHNEMLWVERINRALEEDRFYLYYQPIVALNEEAQDEHYELLIRMKDDAGDMVLPGAFLPAAERYNLSSKIDRWVIQIILTWLDAYSECLERECSWGINLSGQSLADADLLQFVIEEFDRKQIPPQKIYFEITETAAIANLENATRFVNSLKSHGCKFALDDFGSGLSSFSYLKNLPVDFLKIDGMFVKDIANDNIDFVMVKAINDVSHAMGKKTIAEFVENNEIIGKLNEIGVDYAQGYGICKPKPLSEFAVDKQL
jgi:diguanylate cyclase (GGDEF)-like protein/PAS domain S-box-containing protein